MTLAFNIILSNVNRRLSIYIISLDINDAETNHMEHDLCHAAYDMDILVNCDNFGVGASLNGCGKKSFYTRMPKLYLNHSL